MTNTENPAQHAEAGRRGNGAAPGGHNGGNSHRGTHQPMRTSRAHSGNSGSGDNRWLLEEARGKGHEGGYR